MTNGLDFEYHDCLGYLQPRVEQGKLAGVDTRSSQLWILDFLCNLNQAIRSYPIRRSFDCPERNFGGSGIQKEGKK
jgi:hypothetical protein